MLYRHIESIHHKKLSTMTTILKSKAKIRNYDSQESALSADICLGTATLPTIIHPLYEKR